MSFPMGHCSSSDPLANLPPSLPQKDQANIVTRQNMIERRRLLFNFTKFARVGGFPGTLEMPPSFLIIPPSYSIPLDKNMYGYEIKLFVRAVCGDLNASLRKNFVKAIKTLQDYADATGFLKPKPKIISQNEKNLWDWLSDAEFARQRLQGMNPEMIEQVLPEEWAKRFGPHGTTPFDFNSVAGEINAILQQHGAQDFEHELAHGKVYVCDYSLFNDPTVATLARNAFNRYVAAPIVLFYVDSTTRSLHPLAIQLFPGIREGNPVFVSDGSMDWLYAKIWANSVDGQYQEIISHLFEVHLLAETFEISLNRQLGANHPLYQLLHPHFWATIFINETARENLLAQDGPIQSVVGAGTAGAAVLIGKYGKGWNFKEHSFIASLRRRGFNVSNRPGSANGAGEVPPIAGYFWEEDGLKLWKHMYTFVRKVLEVFYKTPEDIENDFELQDFVAELESPTGGCLQGVSERDGKIYSFEHLTDTVTNLMFTCTAKHSAGNIPQFELYGFIPNVPGALYKPPPTARGTTDKALIVASLPPEKETLAQVAITYLLSDTGAATQLLNSTYPGLDKNDEARAAIVEFHKNLKELSDDIATRNTGLTYPYLSLDPAKISNSINI